MLPFGIQQTVETCLAAVQVNRLHTLEYGYRLAMHAALGAANPHLAPATSVRPGSVAGFARRSYLRILAARFVLPLWVAQLPDDDTPQRILADCEQIIHDAEAGLMNEERTDEFFDLYFSNDEDIFDRYFNQDHMRPPGVSDVLRGKSVSAGQVAKYVMGDIWGDLYVLQHGLEHRKDFNYPLEADLSLTDEEYTDYESADSDIRCAIASGVVVNPLLIDNMPGQLDLIRERNRTYWHWWLTDAVAQAWAFRPVA